MKTNKGNWKKKLQMVKFEDVAMHQIWKDIEAGYQPM